jgi:hypothetical protein
MLATDATDHHHLILNDRPMVFSTMFKPWLLRRGQHAQVHGGSLQALPERSELRKYRMGQVPER